jgi:SAM-dependent methyltransferase
MGLDRPAGREAVACELCNAPAQHVFDARGFPMYRCDRCRYAFTAPPPADIASIYGDDYFAGNGDGAGYPDYIAEGVWLRKRGLRYGELLRRHRPAGRVLDVGAAAGFILQGYVDAGWRGSGVEPNASMAAYARERLKVDVRTGTLDSLDPAERFDAISFVQVVAHFPDPKAALARALEVTEPGGLWLFETWNSASLTARALGRSWHGYAPPSAVRALSPHALDTLVKPFGFALVELGRPRKVIDARHAKAVLTAVGRTSALARGARALASLMPDATRLVYPSEDVFWALYRRR